MSKVSISKFKRAHGINPRGYGFWAFQLSNGQVEYITGLYSDAKKEIIRRAVALSLNENQDIYLLS